MPGAARAAFKLDYINNTPLGGGLTQYNYNISFGLSTGQESVISDAGNLSPGTTGSQDFVTIYDITGFVSTSVGASPFSFDIQFLGANGPLTAPPDSSALQNITYRYLGPTTLTANTTFTGISIISTASDTVLGYYTSQQTNVATSGTKIGEVGRVEVPITLERIGDGAVPEPASLAIWGLGALGCAVAGYRRRKHVASCQ